jgi:hypothetical protein
MLIVSAVPYVGRMLQYTDDGGESGRWEIYDQQERMNEIEWSEYDEEGDVLDVYFVEERRPAWTIELTPNIMIRIDRNSRQPVGLTFLDYSELANPTPWGPRSFPITGLADLPLTERELVFAVLNSPPIQ